MMNRKGPHLNSIAFIFVLLLLVALNFSNEIAESCNDEAPFSPATVYVQISGDVIYPGVYGFSRPPDLNSLINKSGGLLPGKKAPSLIHVEHYRSGSKVSLSDNYGRICISRNEMSAFFKITLGIALSLNSETKEGLTAIPGIGPKTADNIIKDRKMRGGYGKTEELLSVPGIGENLYGKIKPLLKL